MSIGGAVKLWISFFLLLIAHFSIRPMIGGPAPIDFLCLAVLFASVRTRPGIAAIIGLLAGLALDSLTLDRLGTAALAFTLVAYGASWLKAAFFGDNLGLTALFVFIGKWSFDLIYVLVSGSVPDGRLMMQLLVWSPIAAALTASTGVLLMVVLLPLFGSRHHGIDSRQFNFRRLS